MNVDVIKLKKNAAQSFLNRNFRGLRTVVNKQFCVFLIMINLISSAITAYLISKGDGARSLASCFCALNPLWIAMDKSLNYTQTAGALDSRVISLWLAFGVSFVLTFISSMMSVRNTVTEQDLENLLVDTLSLLCTGAASGFSFLIWSHSLVDLKQTVFLEQIVACISYCILSSGLDGLNLYLASSVTVVVSLFAFSNFQSIIGIYSSILLAFRLEEVFWSEISFQNFSEDFVFSRFYRSTPY